VMPPKKMHNFNLNLSKDYALVTKHKVKVTHHTSGQVNISMDGKIFTRISKQSIPLDRLKGHLFTVMLAGLDNFGDASGKNTNMDVIQKEQPFTLISARVLSSK